jgi:hypothetical protein
MPTDKFLLAHARQIAALFPPTWTHFENIGQDGAVRIGFQLKLIGVDWTSNDEFGSVLARCAILNIIQHSPENQLLVRANPEHRL